MQASAPCQPLRPCTRKPPLNQRRGLSDPSYFALDLTWARAESDRASRAKAYPSPPMSGSPPLPLKPRYEAGEQGPGSSYQTSHDGYRGIAAATTTTTTTTTTTPTRTTTPPDMRRPFRSSSAQYPSHPQQHQHQHQQLSVPQPHARVTTQPRLSYPPESHDRLPYPPYGRADEPPATTYAQPPPHMHAPAMSGYSSYLPPLPGPASMQQGYPVSPRPPAPAQIPSPVPGPSGAPDSFPPYASPKSQRKTKGHVASACVPCKRAHLRCDAQRPCSRCLSNGKEDACVDVQHKKRGRPRLREERDLRYDLLGRASPGSHSAEPSIHRAVPNMYGQPSGSGYGVATCQGPSRGHRDRKFSQPADSDALAPRFTDRASAADASMAMYPAPQSAPTRPPEPTVFLTTKLEMANASPTFLDAIGRSSVKGLDLLSVISPMERDRVVALQRQMLDERERREPQYLPPIFAKHDEERVLQSLGLTAEDLARYTLDYAEYLTFSSSDGQQRTFPVRLGLAKQDSIYFIVLLLHMTSRPPLGHPTPPSSHNRDLAHAYPPPRQHTPQQHQHQHQKPLHHQQHQQHHQHPLYAQPTPVSAPFDMCRPRPPSDSGILAHRPPPVAAGPSSSMPSGLSPGLSSSYGPSPGRSEYSTPSYPPSYQTPRSELLPGPLPHRQPQPPGANSYQLPPIRSPPSTRPPERSARDDRSRVDIGGLIDRPDPPSRMH